MTTRDPNEAADPSHRDGLPPAWAFEARSLGEPFYFAKKTRPWDWTSLGPDEAMKVLEVCAGFVGFFNARYVERNEQRIPPCWPEHGALVEEITTLSFARWHAFQSPHATIGGAQTWHQRSVPDFLERMGRWLGSDRLGRCQQGLHEDAKDTTPLNEHAWVKRRQIILLADNKQRHEERERRRSLGARGGGEKASNAESGSTPDEEEPEQIPFLEGRYHPEEAADE